MARKISSSGSGARLHDLIQGKGKGCIILLHGVPGIDQTSTAQCLAAYTQMPLYSIPCGDIGYMPAEVEKNMEEFQNGAASCYSTKLTFFSQNAIKPTWSGTGSFPTRKIWKKSLSRLNVINRAREERDQEPIHFNKKELIEWVKLNWELLQWNGRQIRNAFQTAIALAEFHATNEDASIPLTLSRKNSKGVKLKDPLLDVSHFNFIADATLQFNGDLFATHGFDEDELAKRDKIRLPSHKTTLKLKEVMQSRSSSSDESESEVESAGSSSDESAKEAARKKAKRKEKKKKKNSKAKKKSKRAQSNDGSSESDSEAKDKKPKTKKKAKKEQSDGGNDESDKGADGAIPQKE